MSRASFWVFLALFAGASITGAVFVGGWFFRFAESAIRGTCDCARSFFLSHGGLTIAGGALLALPLFGTLLALVRLIVALVQTMRRRRTLLAGNVTALAPGVWRFASSLPEAFTIGFLHPVTYVSDAALRTLSPDARAALLRHEAEHRRRRDPFLRLLLMIAQAFCFWVPGARRLIGTEELALEIRADAAAERVHGRRALHEAMRTFFEPSFTAGAIAHFVAVEDRIALAGRMHTIAARRRQGAAIVFASLFVISTAFAGVAALAREVPGSQCAVLPAACVANLPVASPAGLPASTIQSLPRFEP